MNLKRVTTLLGKELLHGSRSYIFLMAIVMPLAISLLVNLLLGTFFSGQASLGVTGGQGTEFVTWLERSESVEVKFYANDEALRRAIETGAADMGVVIPEGFDARLAGGGDITLPGYIWGESLAKDRMIIGAAITDAARTVAGIASPVTIDSVTLGEGISVPWADRLLPFIVMIAVFLGGLMVPATSLITEKAKRTINAVLVTPASVTDVFISKGTVGLAIAIFMGILILVINQAFGTQPGLLVALLALGALMAVMLGLLAGTALKDFATLFTLWKTAGIVLFAPVIIYLFPGVPAWIGKIFPTYYFLQPIVDISLYGGGWGDIATNFFILLGITIVLGAALIVVAARIPKFAA